MSGTVKDRPRSVPALLAAVLAVFALVAAACGSGGTDDEGATDEPPGLPTSSSALVPTGSSVLPQFGLGSPTAAQGFGQGPPQGIACAPRPPRGNDLPWIPPDLPLPPGTYPVSEIPRPPSGAAANYSRGTLAAKGTLTEFVQFVLREWPKHGWSLGRGEAEPGEAEDAFYKGDYTGAFRVRSSYCEQGWSELFLVYGKRPVFTTVPPPSTSTTATTTP